jgi:tRNA 2-thiouridine synthesizing protein A
MKGSDKELDVSGMSCPMPLIRLSQTVGELGSGETLKIVGDDPVFEQGVRDYCGLNQIEIISVIPLSGRTVEIIIKK